MEEENIFLKIKYLVLKLWNTFILNSIARNITSSLFECLTLACGGYLVYLTVMTPVNNGNLWFLCAYFVPLYLIKLLALRLRITHICPQCQENRGTYCEIYRTGETANYGKRINGDYWEHYQDVECIKYTKCKFCNFNVSETYWKTETWQGELTEEARIRREEEARLRQVAEFERAQKRAQVEAWEQIQRKKRGY